ncbi:MAG: FAD:protein FMN transferase [Spirochaetia bacterium]|nr:FAD:protein FMN transferase [Spirochaetia bacterium]
MLILFAFCILFSSCTQMVIAPQTEYVFGTVCTLNFFDDGTESLYEECFLELRGIDDKFSVNKEYSEISLVNKNAGLKKVSVSREVFEVLELSKMIAEKTDMAFNPVLGSLIKLWAIGTERQRVPEIEEIESARQHCNPDSLVLQNDDGIFYAELTDSKTQIDLGAIVKGYAADRIVKILEKRNVKKAVIDLGGNIYVFGQKDRQNNKWKVGIKNPLNQDSEPVKIVSLDYGSVVTSGNYERFFVENGIRYHHIIDGKTGSPAESNLASVSVIYKESVFCDALATAFFVAGVDADFERKLGLQDVQLVFVKKDGSVVER